MQKTKIATEILAYLVDHPNAQDTLDGILQWWLLERHIKYQKEVVKEALSELIEKGLLLEIILADSRVYYRINETRLDQIRKILGNGK
jgi:hypothetical protein